MMSRNPYLRALAILAYSAGILGLLLVFVANSITALFTLGIVLVAIGVLSLMGHLVVGGITWKAPKVR